jgi:copper resistance protein B
LLLTNRLVLQPLLETEIYGKADPEHRFGAGLATLDLGLRLRYEIRRKIAPYVGLVWSRKFFGTAEFAENAGETPAGTRLTLGFRTWF